MEEDKRDLISREISKFRDTHKVKIISFVLLDLALQVFGQKVLM